LHKKGRPYEEGGYNEGLKRRMEGNKKEKRKEKDISIGRSRKEKFLSKKLGGEGGGVRREKKKHCVSRS